MCADKQRIASAQSAPSISASNDREREIEFRAESTWRPEHDEVDAIVHFIVHELVDVRVVRPSEPGVLKRVRMRLRSGPELESRWRSFSHLSESVYKPAVVKRH